MAVAPWRYFRRVAVFYDRDNFAAMTEVNFRDIPPARYPEDERVSEPRVYKGSPRCFFWSEFRFHWLCADPRIGPLLEDACRPVSRADTGARWLQTRIKRRACVEDVYAYRRRQRFSVCVTARVSSTANSFKPVPSPATTTLALVRPVCRFAEVPLRSPRSQQA